MAIFFFYQKQAPIGVRKFSLGAGQSHYERRVTG